MAVEPDAGLFPPCPAATSHRNPSYPACPGHFQYSWNLTNYLGLFKTLSTSLKAVDSQIPVGGA